jgi:hypothetical protein
MLAAAARLDCHLRGQEARAQTQNAPFLFGSCLACLLRGAIRVGLFLLRGQMAPRKVDTDG